LPSGKLLNDGTVKDSTGDSLTGTGALLGGASGKLEQPANTDMTKLIGIHCCHLRCCTDLKTLVMIGPLSPLDQCKVRGIANTNSATGASKGTPSSPTHR
jgi:uncharacterized protein YciI